MASIACPSCGGDVSKKAFDCPHCGHPLRKPRRGFFGVIFKWSLILFNVAMIVVLFSYLSDIGQMAEGASDDFERAGLGIGATLGVGFLFMVWALGDIVWAWRRC